MNRCMYSSNFQNQMMNSYGHPMQRPDTCHPAQHPNHYSQGRHSDTYHPAHHSDSCHKEPCMEPCKPISRPESCSKPESCAEKPDCHKHEACKEKPKYSRSQMLQYINEVSFAVNDILLYLDTHPCDREAMEFYRKNVSKRDAALCEFAKYYGPLTVDTADRSKKDIWEWVMQPWPWEGREC